MGGIHMDSTRGIQYNECSQCHLVCTELPVLFLSCFREEGLNVPAWQMKKCRITNVRNQPCLPQQVSCRVRWSSGPLISCPVPPNALHWLLNWESCARELAVARGWGGIVEWRGNSGEPTLSLYSHISSGTEVDLCTICVIIPGSAPQWGQQPTPFLEPQLSLPAY